MEFLDRFFEECSNIKFGENGSRVVPFGRTDRPGEANCRFLQFCENAEKKMLVIIIIIIIFWLKYQKFLNVQLHVKYGACLRPKVLTYLLTYRVLLEKLTGFQSQEILRTLWDPKVPYCIHNCSPPVPILSQLDLVHTPAFHNLKIRLNIILPFTPVDLRHAAVTVTYSRYSPVSATFFKTLDH